jgi:FkbM family methyltransferase
MKDAEKRVVVRRWLWIGLPVAAGAALAWCYRDWLAARFFLRHLESERRLKRLRVPEVVRLLDIEPGSTVADIGAGSGLFTGRFVDCVGPTGRVFAADANPTMIDHLRKRFPPDRAPTVTVVQTARSGATLPAKVDLAFVCLTLHHIPDPEEYVQTLAEDLKPGGRIAVIEFERHSPMHHKMIATQELDRWMEEAGLQVVSREDNLLEEAYIRIYGRA